jgi:Phospholipase A2-like domain
LTTLTIGYPLTDINGSTLALVNSASPTSPPGATYTYDPSGNVSINGSNVTSWPFQYQGMEHEPTDPANLYFNSSSNVYNPQMQNMLSQVGAQGLGGPSIASPDGPGAAGPSGQSGGPSWQKTKNDFQQAWDVSEGYPSATYSDGEGASVALPLGAVAFGIDFLVNFFEDLFSGPNSPPIPRKLMHKRHPLYGEILGIDGDLIPTEGSSPLGGGTASDSLESSVSVTASGGPSNAHPLQRPEYSSQIIPVQFPGYNYCGPGNNGGATTPNTTDNCCKQHDLCYSSNGLNWIDAILHLGGLGVGAAQAKCDRALCDCVGTLKSAPLSGYDYRMRNAIQQTFCY